MSEYLLRNYVKYMLLNERRSGRKVLQALKNQIVRDVMYLATGKMNKISVGVERLEDSSYEDAYTLYGYAWKKKIDVADLDENEREWVEDNPEIDVSVAITSDPSRKNYNVSGGSVPTEGDVGIDILIEFPKDWQSKNFQALQAELGNTVIHELEHLTQTGSVKGFDRGERYYDFDRSGEVHSPMAKDYFLKPDEVAAHVMGYSDVAASMDDLENRMNSDLQGYASRGSITDEEVGVILYSWLDWAKKNLNKKRFQ